MKKQTNAILVSSLARAGEMEMCKCAIIQYPVSNDDGMSIGCCLLVHGLSPGEATLGVTVLDYSDEKMKFDLEVVE